jgi:WD40 repeat protein/mono/diheme cytochrome c family protein
MYVRCSTFAAAAALLIALAATAARAQDKPVSYFNDVRPIFVSSCNACHKPEKTKGDLDMTAHANLLKGGKHGASVTPGDPKKSRLLEMISGPEPEMPEDGDPLKPEQVKLIERWIKEGAVDDTPKAGTLKVETPRYLAPPVVTTMAFSPDGSLLAVNGYHEVVLHKADGSGVVGRLIGEAPRVESIAFNADGSRLAVAGGAPAEFGQVQVWDVKSQKADKVYSFSTDSLFGVSFAPDGKSVAFGGADKIVRRVNLEDGKLLLDFRAHADWVLGTAFTIDGKHLVSGGRDKAIKYIDLANQQFIDDVNNPFEPVISFARHPKQDLIAYGGELGTPRMYQISDNQRRTAGRIDTNLKQMWERQPGPASAVAFSPDGERLAVGTAGEVRVYGVKDPKRQLTMTGITGPVFAIAWKPDGKILAAAGFDGKVRLFETVKGELVKEFSPVPLDGTASK